MGCGASTTKTVAVSDGQTVPKGADHADAAVGEPVKAAPTLTEAQIQKVSESWEAVAKDLTLNGVAFFKKVFELAPEALQLFSFKDEPNMYESPALHAHATKVG